MGIFRNQKTPEMSEIFPTQLLQKFDSGRTKLDVERMILHITEGIYPLASNQQKPKFKSLEEFDASAKEILGSLDDETFPEFIKMLIFEPQYLNRFIQIASNQVQQALSQFRELLNKDLPISVNSSARFSKINNQITLISIHFSHVVANLGQHISPESLLCIAKMHTEIREFGYLYFEELQRSIRYLEDN